MVSKITSTKRSRAAFTIPEMLLAAGITGILVLVLTSISMFSGRTFVAFANYVDLDDANRIAMDTLTRDLRECDKVTACTTSTLTIQDSDGVPIVYTYNAGTQMLTRTKNTSNKVLLKGCDTLTFAIAQRNPVGGTYDVYPAATPATAKVVNVKWNCSRTIFGRKANTENVQTARIVIRKQDNS